MKKYHSHALLYLHETVALGSGRSDRFSEMFTDVYHPMMEELGARLFAIWESTPYNGHWPQVTIIWEIDGFSDYARIGRAQARGGWPQVGGREVVDFPGRDRRIWGGQDHVSGSEQQDARSVERGGFRCGAGDPRDHAN